MPAGPNQLLIVHRPSGVASEIQQLGPYAIESLLTLPGVVEARTRYEQAKAEQRSLLRPST